MGMSAAEIRVIFEKSKEIDQLRKEHDDDFLEINKLYRKLQSSPDFIEKSGGALLQRLQSLCIHAKEILENEMSASSVLIAQLDALLQSGLSAAQQQEIEVIKQKRKRMKKTSDIPRIPKALAKHLECCASLNGEQVAARVTPQDAEKDEWYVVKVIHFDKNEKVFVVLDEEPDEDEENLQREYKLPLSSIIPFPKKSDPISGSDFLPGEHVLAVYPGTTALYKATVVNHRKRKTDDYLLEFEDDEEDDILPQRAVPYDRVVPLPLGHRQ